MIPEPDPFSLGIQFDLHKDLSFIPALVKEGDIQNAVTVSLVMWEFLKEDAYALKVVPIWVNCYLDLLSREEMYEEIVNLRNVCYTLGIDLLELFVQFQKQGLICRIRKLRFKQRRRRIRRVLRMHFLCRRIQCNRILPKKQSSRVIMFSLLLLEKVNPLQREEKRGFLVVRREIGRQIETRKEFGLKRGESKWISILCALYAEQKTQDL